MLRFDSIRYGMKYLTDTKVKGIHAYIYLKMIYTYLVIVTDTQ